MTEMCFIEQCGSMMFLNWIKVRRDMEMPGHISKVESIWHPWPLYAVWVMKTVKLQSEHKEEQIECEGSDLH